LFNASVKDHGAVGPKLVRGAKRNRLHLVFAILKRIGTTQQTGEFFGSGSVGAQDEKLQGTKIHTHNSFEKSQRPVYLNFMI
jgi:hypothetical protein